MIFPYLKNERVQLFSYPTNGSVLLWHFIAQSCIDGGISLLTRDRDFRSGASHDRVLASFGLLGGADLLPVTERDMLGSEALRLDAGTLSGF